MPLTNFVWDDEMSVHEGLEGVWGAAVDAATGKTIKIFVEKSAIDKADRIEIERDIQTVRSVNGRGTSMRVGCD